MTQRVAQRLDTTDDLALSWQQCASGRILGMTALTRPLVAVAATLAMLGGSWLISYSVGGASVVPPLWFFVAIIFASVRFGALGALVTALASAVLAGPLLPADTATGAAQAFHHWAVRGGFFVAIGLFVALFLYEGRPLRASALATIREHRSLRRALAAGELEVHYQPVFDIRGPRERIVGAEALVRWRHPKAGLVGPDHFIPVAERTELIHDLGEMVLREAARQVGRWSELIGRERFVVGVNLSARQLADPDLVARVRQCLDETDVDRRRLSFEVTETALMGDTEASHDRLVELGALGCGIMVDDFGTGYSSLAYIHRFPIDTIKIDRCFVERVVHDDSAASIVSTIIELTHTLGLQALAEGIETAEELRILKTMGCDLAQGYLLAMPGPAEETTSALMAQAAKKRRRSQTRAPQLAHR
jgi:EAL domain-containing protein (putative c-di-GMP-specific phosphodiesterase class I)